MNTKITILTLMCIGYCFMHHTDCYSMGRFFGIKTKTKPSKSNKPQTTSRAIKFERLAQGKPNTPVSAQNSSLWEYTTQKASNVFSTPKYTPLLAYEPMKPWVFSKLYTWITKGTSFKEQNRKVDEQNRRIFQKIVQDEIIDKHWEHKPDKIQALRRYKEYINAGTRPMLQRAFEAFLETDFLHDLLKYESNLQQIADRLYDELFPSYVKDPIKRKNLDTLRANLWRYINTLIDELNAGLMDKKPIEEITGSEQVKKAYADKIQGILRDIYIISLLLEESERKFHHGIIDEKQTRVTSIADFLMPLIKQLEKLAQREKIDFDALDANALEAATRILEAKRIQDQKKLGLIPI